MGDHPKPDKDQILDCLVLAFAHSDLANAVDSEALRSVLRLEIHDLVRDDGLDLQLAWELLEEQPGFTAEAATPAVCTIKTWEDKLGRAVQMPDELAGLNEKDVNLAAGKIVVPASELKLALRLTTGKQRATPAREAAPEPAKRARKERPKWLGWAAAVVAVGTFTFAGVTLYRGCPRDGGGDWQTVSVKVTEDELALKDGSRLGNQVQATLRDDAWKKRSEDEKRLSLKNALILLDDQKVRVLVVKDSRGNVVGTAQKTRTDDVSVFVKP